ncbi:hypothetical protein [Niastella vici]|nr:hypothetical protein [Niastella vici]
MKKAKLMLTGIAILAIVGGALAFKAKSAFSTQFCTSTTSGTCVSSFQNGKTATSGTRTYYVVTDDPTACASAALNCSGDKNHGNITTSTTFIVAEP